MRKTLTVTAIVLGVLAAIVLVMTMTPLGFSVATNVAESSVSRDTGLSLSLGSLSGNLLGDVRLEDVELSVPDGPALATVERASVRYDLLAVVLHKTFLAEIEAEGVSVLVERAGDALVGWDDLARRSPDEPDSLRDGRALTYEVVFSLADVDAAYRDTTAGLSIDVVSLGARGTAATDAYSATVEGSLAVLARGMRAPLSGSMIVELAGGDAGLDLSEASFSSEPLRATVSGSAIGDAGAAGAGVAEAGAAGPEGETTAALALDVEAELDLAGALALADTSLGAVPTVAGRLLATAAIGGNAGSPSYTAEISSELIEIDDLAVEGLAASLAGDAGELDVKSLTADLLGGSLSVEASIGLTDESAGAPSYAFQARCYGISLTNLARGLPREDGGARPELAGEVAAAVVLSGAGSDPTSLDGSFDARVRDLSVDGRDLGELAIEGGVSAGTLALSARCCSTDVAADGALSEDGIDRIAFSVECRDLSVPGAAWGVTDLTGSIEAQGTLDVSSDEPAVELDVSAPEGSYAGVAFGPAAAAVDWAGGRTRATFTAFGGTATGAAGVDARGAYDASFALDDFDIGLVVPDSVRSEWALRGSVSATASVSGDTSSLHLCEGEVSLMRLEALGHTASLDAPFAFRASADSVSVTPVSMTSDFGRMEVAGRLGSDDEGRIAARFDDIDVAAFADLAPAGSPPFAGMLNGTVFLEGDLSRPGFEADVTIDGLTAAGIDFRSVALSAAGDTSDIIFDVIAESADSGAVYASGSLPIIVPRGGLPSPDPLRELGLSILCDRLSLDLGDHLLPDVRGTRRFSANGSVLLVGRPDSLRTLNGRGSFDELSVNFDLLEFAATDTVEFDVDGGVVDVLPATIAVTRRRVLEDEAGGEVEFQASVRADGSLSGSVVARGIQVGRLVRTFAPRSAIDVRGDLDVEAVLGGTIADPDVGVTWKMVSPVISDLRFSETDGSARMSRDVVTIERAALRSGTHSVEVAGVVPLPARPASAAATPAGGRPTEFDLVITAREFDLASVRPQLREIKRIGGTLDVALRVEGPPDAPVLRGGATLEDGVFEGYDMMGPVTDVSASVTADGGTIVLNEASAGLGGGSVRASGFVAAEPGTELTFWLKVVLDLPEFGVEDSFEARLSGDVVWGGTLARSQMSGEVFIEEALVSHDVGLLDLLERRPVRVVVRRPDDPLANAALDLDVSARERIIVENSFADLELEGGVHVGGTLQSPTVSGAFYAEEGSFRFLENEFRLETMSIAFIDPRRRDPHIDLMGVADVTDRDGEDYVVTVRVRGFAQDVVPQLTSEPPLTQPDIVALLTFGQTAGALVQGRGGAASSGDRFGALARGAFLSSAFGVAESALERLLRLDTLTVDDEAIIAGDAANADVTLGKEFGGRLRVNYTTAVGRLDEQQIELALELAKYLALESRADPEGNHAIDLRFRIPFR